MSDPTAARARDEQPAPAVWWDRATGVVFTDAPTWPAGTFTPEGVVRLVLEQSAPAGVECPTPTHHPLTVYPVCHPGSPAVDYDQPTVAERETTADELAEAEQAFSYLLASVVDDSDEHLALGKIRDLLDERGRELERLHELADDTRLAWVRMAPNPRTAVRTQSEELYNALGALSTYVSTKGGA